MKGLDLSLKDMPTFRLTDYDTPKPTRTTRTPRDPTTPRDIGGVPLLPWGSGGGLGGGRAAGSKTGIFGRTIKRDIGNLSIMGKKGIFSDMVGRAKKK